MQRSDSMKIQKIFEFLNLLYPIDTACDFDNPGLLVGDGEADAAKVLVCLDCTAKTIEIAKNEGCNLIITHHPVIFSPLKNILSGSIVYELILSGISVISMHTNLDMGDGGVNDCLCEAIGLRDITALTANDGFILKSGILPPISADDFAKKIQKALGGRVKYVDGGKAIEKVLVCSGSGGEFIEDAVTGGFDALVTSDIKHHIFLTAEENGVSLFDAGHFETEDICIEPLTKKLKAQFPETEFITHHSTDFKYV